MSLIKNTAWSAVAAIALSGGRFLISMTLARKLEVEEFGEFVFTQWLVDIVFLCLAFGTNGCASRFFAEFQTQPEKILAFERWFVKRSLFVIMTVGIVLPISSALINKEVNSELALLQAGWAILAATWTLLIARTQGLHRFKRLALSNIAYIAVTLLGIILLSAENITISAVISLIIKSITIAILIIWTPLLTKKLANDQKVCISGLNHKEIRNFGLNVWITSAIGAFVWSRGEISIVRAELDVANLAIYLAALSVVAIATQGVMLLTGALGVHLTKLWGESKQQEAIDLSCRFTDLFTLMAGILSSFLIIFSLELIQFSFGENYLAAKPLLILLSIGVIGFTSAAANQLLLLRTNGKFSRNLNFFAALGLFAIAIPLIDLMGIEGAAISRALIQIGISASTFYFSCRLISKDTVNWVNQVKVSLIIFLVIFLSMKHEMDFQFRVSLFILSALIIITWVRDGKGKIVLFSTLNIVLYRIRHG